MLLWALLPVLPALAGEASEAYETSLAMQQSNLVAASISVPLQLNFDRNIGPADGGPAGFGFRMTLTLLFPG